MNLFALDLRILLKCSPLHNGNHKDVNHLQKRKIVREAALNKQVNLVSITILQCFLMARMSAVSQCTLFQSKEMIDCFSTCNLFAQLLLYKSRY